MYKNQQLKTRVTQSPLSSSLPGHPTQSAGNCQSRKVQSFVEAMSHPLVEALKTAAPRRGQGYQQPDKISKCIGHGDRQLRIIFIQGSA